MPHRPYAFSAAVRLYPPDASQPNAQRDSPSGGRDEDRVNPGTPTGLPVTNGLEIDML